MDSRKNTVWPEYRTCQTSDYKNDPSPFQELFLGKSSWNPKFLQSKIILFASTFKKLTITVGGISTGLSQGAETDRAPKR